MRCLYTLQKFANGQSMHNALRFEGSMREHLIGLKNGAYSEFQFLEAVKVWHDYYGEQVGNFFHETEAKPFIKDELKENMFEFVKSKMLV